MTCSATALLRVLGAMLTQLQLQVVMRVAGGQRKLATGALQVSTLSNIGVGECEGPLRNTASASQVEGSRE